jgi:hypothetical protein
VETPRGKLALHRQLFYSSFTLSYDQPDTWLLLQITGPSFKAVFPTLVRTLAPNNLSLLWEPSRMTGRKSLLWKVQK